MLRFLCGLVICLGILVSGVDAKEKKERWYFVGLSPVVILDGKTEPAGHFFAGMEGDIWRFAGYSLDVGYAAGWEALDYGYGVMSAGALVSPIHYKSSALFFSVGYTFGFRGQHANFLHTGLGMRIKERIRLEVRDYVNFDGRDPNTHIWAFRLGLVF